MTKAGVVYASSPGVLFQIFLFLHILCVVGGFGGLAYRALALDLARRRGAVSTAGVLDVYGQISIVAEVLIYGVFVFGIATLAAANNSSEFHKPWLPIAIGVYVVMMGLLHGLVRPAEKRYRKALLELAETPAMAPPARPPQLEEMDSLYRRIGAGMGGFNVLLLAALYLMIFRP